MKVDENFFQQEKLEKLNEDPVNVNQEAEEESAPASPASPGPVQPAEPTAPEEQAPFPQFDAAFIEGEVKLKIEMKTSK